MLPSHRCISCGRLAGGAGAMIGGLLHAAAIGGLIVLNGLFVAAEFALVSARAGSIDELADAGSRSARQVQRALADPNRFISACQLGITLSSLILGVLLQPLVATPLATLLERWEIGLSNRGVGLLALALALLAVTIVHIIVGEQIPKMIGYQRAERTILATILPIVVLSWPFRPLIGLIYRVTDRALTALGLERQDDHRLVYTEEELRQLVSASRSEGYLEPAEQAMIERVFSFADVHTDEVMTPRTEMQALPRDATLETVYETVTRTGLTRFPVYGEDPDDLIGIFDAKDLLRQSVATSPGGFRLLRFVKPAVIVSTQTPLDELLATLKRTRSRMAIVVDEYGGTAGLVTLEDVLEHIVGDVEGGQNGGPDPIVELDDGTLSVSGLVSLTELNERLGTDVSDDFYHSVGGYVFGQLGRRPEIGDTVPIDGYEVEVAGLDGVRIDRVTIRRRDDTRHDLDEPVAAMTRSPEEPESLPDVERS